MQFDSTTDESIKNIYIEFLHALNERKSLVFYRKSPNHDDFYTSMIVALMKNDVLMRDFDYLTYAASMFQLQEYTKQKLFSAILLDSSKNHGYNIFDIEKFM